MHGILALNLALASKKKNDRCDLTLASFYAHHFGACSSPFVFHAGLNFDSLGE